MQRDKNAPRGRQRGNRVRRIYGAYLWITCSQSRDMAIPGVVLVSRHFHSFILKLSCRSFVAAAILQWSLDLERGLTVSIRSPLPLLLRRFWHLRCHRRRLRVLDIRWRCSRVICIYTLMVRWLSPSAGNSTAAFACIRSARLLPRLARRLPKGDAASTIVVVVVSNIYCIAVVSRMSNSPMSIEILPRKWYVALHAVGNDVEARTAVAVTEIAATCRSLLIRCLRAVVLNSSSPLKLLSSLREEVVRLHERPSMNFTPCTLEMVAFKSDRAYDARLSGFSESIVNCLVVGAPHHQDPRHQGEDIAAATSEPFFDLGMLTFRPRRRIKTKEIVDVFIDLVANDAMAVFPEPVGFQILGHERVGRTKRP